MHSSRTPRDAVIQLLGTSAPTRSSDWRSGAGEVTGGSCLSGARTFFIRCGQRGARRGGGGSYSVHCGMNPLLHDLCPPLVARASRWRANGLGWSGDFPTWQTAAARCAGYDQPAILEQIRLAAGRVRAGAGAYERDAVVFEEPAYSWPLLAVLLEVAAAHGGILRVLDFGGSLGSAYFQHQRWLDPLAGVEWSVVEQEHFVRCGREEFADDRLRFFSSIADCLAAGRPDLVLLSSVLGYLPDPAAVLGELAGIGAGALLIDRTGFTRNDRERITVQRVPEDIYPATYPCRFFSRTALVRRLAPRYELVAAFPALDEPPLFAEFLGLYFERRRQAGTPVREV